MIMNTIVLGRAASRFAVNMLVSDSEWNKIPTVKLSADAIRRTCVEWAEARGYNRWIVLCSLGS